MPQPEKVEGALFRGGVYYLNKRGLPRRSLRTASAEEARQKVAAILSRAKEDRDRIALLDAGRMLWTDAVVRYHDEVGEKSLRPATLSRYLVSFKGVHPHLSPLYMDEITPRVLVRMASARREQGVTNATINRDLTAISRVMACAVAWGVSASNPTHQFDRTLLTNETREARYIPTDEDIEVIAAACPGLLSCAVRFARLEGARQEEIFSLTWDAVDLAEGSVIFMRTKTSRRRGAPRTIALSDKSQSLLASLPPPPKGGKKGPVFWHGTGSRYANPATYFAKLRQNISAKTGVPAFTFHDLRHAYAVSELKTGRDIYDLARHMGHSTVTTTEGYLGYVPGGKPLTRGSRVTQRTPPENPTCTPNRVTLGDECNGSDLPDPI